MSTAEEFRRRAELCERRAATGGLTYSAKGRILRLADLYWSVRSPTLLLLSWG
jgi:hypothetical protein